MSRCAGRVAMGVAAASVAGVAAFQPAAVTAPVVDLAALIVVGSSTNPTGAGVEDFFQGKFNDPVYTGPNGDDIVYVNFWSGTEGIARALDANAGEQNAIIASGWGGANASLLALKDRPDLSDTLLILDNDVSRPDGGFGTRYPWYAWIGVNPFPTPSEVPALRAVNIGYEYDYNSNAPAVLLNPLAAVNSLVGYLYRHRNQAELDLPVNVDGTPAVECDANTCAITVSGAVLDCPDARCGSPEDPISTYVTSRNNTTYVTYAAEELPLTRLMRDVFGRRIAAFTDPLLRLLVDSAYYGGNPIPRDPSAYRPATLFPSLIRVLDTIVRIPGAIAEGWKAATAPPKAPAAKTTTKITSEEEDTSAADTSAADTSTADTSEQDASEEDTSFMDSPTVERALSSWAQALGQPSVDEVTQTSEIETAEDAELSETPTDDESKPRTNVVRTSIKAEPGTVGFTNDTGADSESVDTEADSATESGSDSPQISDDETGATQDTGEESESAESTEDSADDESTKQVGAAA